jgi:multidrug efflux pump subunit AcrB
MRAVHKLVPILALFPVFGSPFAAAQPAASAKPLPTVTVEVSYPGASASVVVDSVAAPIEQQIHGVAGLLHMRSRSANGGRYVLSLTFKEEVDIAEARVLVQNRVALAQPVLPELVKQTGITIRQSAQVLLYIAVSSPDGTKDTLDLRNYAAIHVVDKLKLIAGVSNVKTIGRRVYSVRVWLDPQKLAARELTAGDIVEVIKEQNAQVAAGQIGQPPTPGGQFQFEIKTRGRLTDAEELGKIVVKSSKADGRLVRLQDVAKVQLGACDSGDRAFVNGKEVVVLAVHPTWDGRPDKVSEAVRKKLAELQKLAPPGLKMDVAINFTPGPAKAPHYCRIDVDLPADASVERTALVLNQCQDLVRKSDGVQDVLALTDESLPNRGQLLVSLVGGAGAAERAKQIKALREQLPTKELAARIRVCGPSDGAAAPLAYPVQFAVCNKTNEGLGALRKQADLLAERLEKIGKLSDVWAGDALDHPFVQLSIDRKQALALGVAMGDVFNNLQGLFGSFYVNDFNDFGQTWQVTIAADDRASLEKLKRGLDGLKPLTVRNKDGQMVPLAKLVSGREVWAPAVIDRYDMEPMIAITANLAPGVSPAEARTLCEKAAEPLPAGYRLKWLRELPEHK